VGNPVGDNPGLSGTRPGDDQHRPLDGGYRPELGAVELCFKV
jgi:hypothetical protein